ncbi:hypothetical protein AMS68_001036 [Peltaster fructicola]|uniref:Zn(2)-C6 fungal-type domain-containing protein n=1 Tax=Peltaster fructicola TaxID=286661 RepID=A0A6H0XLL3_9PEZI|nr:hypothetical protein AMS68_001036 [Peltaster fructicola]
MHHASSDDYDEHASEIESGEEDGDSKHDITSTSPQTAQNAKARPVKATHMQKRRRVTRACDECRRKKIKCDGKQPCTHCTVYSYECTYDQPSNRRRNPAPQYVESLEHRVHRAETLLHILIPNLDLNDPGIEAAVAQGWIPGAPGKGDPTAALTSSLPTAAASSAAPAVNASSAPTALKGEANLESMVRAVAQLDIDNYGNYSYHGHSSGLSFMRRMREQLGELMGPDVDSTPFVKTRPRSQVHDSPRSALDSPSIADSPGSDLPPRDVARQFCNNALNHAAAILRVVHQPSFWASFERIYSVAPELYQNDDHRFLPLLYSVMALGCLFGREEITTSLGNFGYENAIQQGFAYFKSARQMMDIADCRDLMSVQAIVFMILFMQSSAKLSQCYAYVGVALRSALRMGLHRAHTGAIDHIEAETRKRVFWVIRKMDIYVGAMLGLPQTLSDEDIDQEFPAEVDDEYITKDGIKPMPDGTLSVLAGFNAHTRLVLLLQKIVRKIYPIKVSSQTDKSYSVPISAIREIEADLEAWKANLHPELCPSETPSRYTRIQLLLRLAYAHAQVLLYRPFLHFVTTHNHPKPVDQRAYACGASYVNVSRNIVHITTQMRNKGLLNGAFWFIMYTSFFSILSLVYFAAGNPENPGTEAIMRDALEGKEVLASLATRSMAADRCSATLDGIFARLPSWLREGKQNPVASKKRQIHRPATISTLIAPEQSQPTTPTSADFNMPRAQTRAQTFPTQGPEQRVAPTSLGQWPQAVFAGANHGASNGMPMDFSDPASSAALPSHVLAPLPDVSAMMFPGGGDEPFNYPNQPLTAFESNQQQASKTGAYANGSIHPQYNDHNLMNPGAAIEGRDDNFEAQFFALPIQVSRSIVSVGIPPYSISNSSTNQQQEPQAYLFLLVAQRGRMVRHNLHNLNSLSRLI